MIGIFLDTETNGLDSKIHCILEIAYKIVDLTNGEVLEQYETIVAQPPEALAKNDQRSVQIHGISLEKIAQGQSKEAVAAHIIDSFTKFKIIRHKAVFICQNPSFDRSFFSQLIPPYKQEELNWPYHWLDLASMYWAISIHRYINKEDTHLPWKTGLSKDQIASYYKLGPEATPHRAMNGVAHLFKCYSKVVGFPDGK